MNLPKRCALSTTQQKLHRHRFLTGAPQCLRLAQNRIRPVTVKKTTKSSAEPHKTQNKKNSNHSNLVFSQKLMAKLNSRPQGDSTNFDVFQLLQYNTEDKIEKTSASYSVLNTCGVAIFRPE